MLKAGGGWGDDKEGSRRVIKIVVLFVRREVTRTTSVIQGLWALDLSVGCTDG